MSFLSRRLILARGLLSFGLLPLAFTLSARTYAQSNGVQIRFLDSATGYAVQPEVLRAEAEGEHVPTTLFSRVSVASNGRMALQLQPGRQQLRVEAAKYLPREGEFRGAATDGYRVNFYLDPINPPAELEPENIAKLHRAEETVFVGFVVDDESGQPLGDVLVRTQPSGREARTDTRGYFQIYAPVQTHEEARTAPASLVFAKAGYTTDDRRYLELWSGGDWIYRVRLVHGDGVNITDERQFRRRSEYPISARGEEPGAMAKQTEAFVPPGGGSPPQLASTTAHVRIPTNIRVLRQDGVTIDYLSLQTYCQRSLPSEWIASWGSTGPGSSGTNSLLAGAVAVRTYAIGYVNSPANANYDICGTTSCQAYHPDVSDSRTTAAVNFTANYVMFKPGDPRIGFKITEYSAENNSLGFSCGDGFTQPTGGCIYDPICSGESRFGHGRGMCQWGTARWASGRRMAGRVTSDSVTNGYPLQNWIWLCEHYYPNLVLAQGAPLLVGDDVKALGTANLTVRQCPGNTITNGVNCASVATKATGSLGTIIGGPLRVTSDGAGHTWWRVDWGDANGWCVENYLERVSASPIAPSALSATPVSPFQINLIWTDNSANEMATYVERAHTAGGPWTTNALLRAGFSSWSDTNVSPVTTYFYRARQFNQTAASAYSNVTNATTPGVALVLATIPDMMVVEGNLLTFTNSATAAGFDVSVADLENFSAGAAVLFRVPNFSGSTDEFLSNAPNLCAVSASLPSGNASSRAINVNWSFTNTAVNPWLRLTTSSAANLPNPVIDFTKRFRFRIWTDKAMRVGMGLRETTTAAGTAIGANGGASGGIEWVGVTNSVGGQPQPTRLLPANTWTTLEFNLPSEPALNFFGGDGVLSTPSGLGTLEHLAFVPAAGHGAYNVFLDDFTVFTPNALTYSLDPGAPTNAAVDPATGVFTWTPTEAQGPGVYNITVRVTDSSQPPQSDTDSFSVTVNETNSAPMLAAISNRVVHAGALVLVTNSASDADVPANSLAFSLDAGAPFGAVVTNGVFSWQTSSGDVGATNQFTIRVTDNGAPPLADARQFSVAVVAPPMVTQAEVMGTDFVLTWSAIPGTRYRVQFKNNLEDANWLDLMPDVIAENGTSSKIDALEPSQRFYRVTVR